MDSRILALHVECDACGSTSRVTMSEQVEDLVLRPLPPVHRQGRGRHRRQAPTPPRRGPALTLRVSLARLIVRLSGGSAMKRLPFAFYNLAPAGDPQRGAAFVSRESEAIVNNRPRNLLRRRPKVFGVVEAIARRLPELEHYTLIRDTSTPSRANVALYVRNGLKVGTVRWIDHRLSWPRVLHPGLHEPRSTLVVTVEDWTVVVAHAPQVGARMDAARKEWLDIEAHLLAAANRNWPVLLLSDSNALWDELLKRNAGTAMGGTPVESAHVRHAVLRRVRVPGAVRGVPMLSDHKKCLLGTAVRS